METHILEKTIYAYDRSLSRHRQLPSRHHEMVPIVIKISSDDNVLNAMLSFHI